MVSTIINGDEVSENKGRHELEVRQTISWVRVDDTVYQSIKVMVSNPN